MRITAFLGTSRCTCGGSANRPAPEQSSDRVSENDHGSRTRFLRHEHEWAYLLAKGRPSLPASPVPDVLDFPYSGNKLHPTQKPVQPLKTLVRSFTRPGAVTRQIQSVEAADALRILEKESQLKSTSLTQVQRQTNLNYRQAIEELRRTPAGGFQKLEAIGAVRQVPLAERAHAVEQAYSQARLRANSQGLPSEVLIVAPTHEEIDRATSVIRNTRKSSGELGQSTPFQRHLPLNYTTAQRKDFRSFQPGQILEFHRAVKGAAKNESLEVVRTGTHEIVARNAQDEERAFTAKQARAFDVYECQTIDLAPQDRLLLTANRRETGFRATNGELVTVDGIDDQGRIRLEDGRVLPANYRQLTYGYAVTVHNSQARPWMPSSSRPIP